MLKALAGGGGKGMRLVRSEEEAETALRLSQSEAGTSFGNDAVYIEKYIENPHHIEVQIMEINMAMWFIWASVNVPFSDVIRR